MRGEQDGGANASRAIKMECEIWLGEDSYTKLKVGIRSTLVSSFCPLPSLPLSLIPSRRTLPSPLPSSAPSSPLHMCVPFSSYPRRDIMGDDILSQHERVSDLLLHHMRSLGDVCQEVTNALHTSQLGRRNLVARDGIERRVKGAQLQFELDESLVNDVPLFIDRVIP